MKWIKRLIKWTIVLGFFGALAGATTLGVLYLRIKPTLPDVQTLREVQLQVPLRVYSSDGSLMSVYGEQRRMPMPVVQMPDLIKQAFLAAEDARFYEHPGVDYQGISRAVWHVVKTGGEKGPGGSTITMQVARHFGLVSREKSYIRKLREIFLALQMERELSKDEILGLYLNKGFLGNRAYGVVAAAQTYYGKTLDELTVAEAAMLAGIPQRPSRVNPIVNPEAAVARRNYVLRQMLKERFIDQPTFDSALASDDFAFLHQPSIELSAPYAAELARAWIVEHLGEDAYTGGYQVYTTFDTGRQIAASRALVAALRAYDERHGYRGPEHQAELLPEDGPDQWNAILDRFSAHGGLQPALITEVAEEMATAYLADGQLIPLGLEQMVWAKPYIDMDRVGEAPENCTDVVAAGDVVRIAMNDDGVWQLSQLPEVEGALVSLRPEDGALQALVGGFDYYRSKFNRVTQGQRQPGSSFKPFVYSAALDKDFTPASIVNDAPVVFRDPQLERVWKPQNYSETFYGPTRLREGMVNSRNLISIRVLRDIGVRYAWEFVQRFGFIGDEIPQDLSMALGSGSVTPITMARAYAAFANGGYLVEPYFIERIVDGEGNLIYSTNPERACDECQERADFEAQQAALAAAEAALAEELADATAAAESVDSAAPELDTEAADAESADDESLLGSVSDSEEIVPDSISLLPEQPQGLQLADRVIEPSTRFLIDSILADVITRGTGRKAMELERGDLRGKTGTTNDQMDAWFSGYNRELVTTAWVGFDEPRPMGRGEVGGRAALPMWIEFMSVALKDVPEFTFDMPKDVVFARINPESGLLATAGRVGSILEVFQRDKMPDRESEAARNVGPEGSEEDNPYDIF